MYDALMSSATFNNDPYILHKLALSPLLPSATNEDLANSCEQIRSIGEQRFQTFLLQQGLAPMWDKKLESSEVNVGLTRAFKRTLHHSRLETVGTYMIHRHRLTELREILESTEIPHVVYKGAHNREYLYEEPALRVAADIDVLVPNDKKIEAIKAFKRHDFQVYALAEIISHEICLFKGNTSIDLHWDILRPGRTRVPMTESLLETREDYGTHWGMSDEALLFVMLVHPVFVKYGTAPQASLMRFIDLAKLLAKPDLNWRETIYLLDKAGLKTAAWITLNWFNMLTNIEVPEHVINEIQPGKLRNAYLTYWLNKNLSSQLLESPIYIQLALTLPAHDKFTDAIRAIRRIGSFRKTSSADLSTLLDRVNEP